MHVELCEFFTRNKIQNLTDTNNSNKSNVHKHKNKIHCYRMKLAPPKIATFSFGDEPLNFGESASAQCTISGGDLPMEVKWTLNGMDIPSYLEVSTSKIGKRINILSIESVKADHAGNFSCIASNRAGIAEFTAPLIVIGSLINDRYECSYKYIYVGSTVRRIIIIYTFA